MKDEQQVPPGIVAFKSLVDGEILINPNKPELQWEVYWLSQGLPIHTISVGRIEWNIGDEEETYGKVESFEYDFDDQRWLMKTSCGTLNVVKCKHKLPPPSQPGKEEKSIHKIDGYLWPKIKDLSNDTIRKLPLEGIYQAMIDYAKDWHKFYSQPSQPVQGKEDFKYFPFPHELKQTPDEANAEQSIEFPTIHLSGTDGDNVSDASQIIFHKYSKGDLSIEFYPTRFMAEFYKIGSCFTFQLTPEARKILRDFLNSEKGY